MILGIDASNIRAGGGVTHLVELLRAANPSVHGFEKVIVWGGKATLDKIDNCDWLQKVYDPLLDRSLPYRLLWQRFRLKKYAESVRCDMLFVPGGFDLSGFQNIVTMSQNLLPFDWDEMRRFGFSLTLMRLLLLRIIQSQSFYKADGVIFLTKYARDAVLKVTGTISGKINIIPHGINSRFSMAPKSQSCHTYYYRLLYVSIVDVYKHQWHVAEAVAQLRAEGIPIILDLVGPPGGGILLLQEAMNRLDSEGAFITYRGSVPYEQLDGFYKNADIAVFASTCETFGMILIEAMSAGLPIACSNRSAMPEILGDAGLYFDPEDSHDIARALRELINQPDLRQQLAQAAFERAKQFTWRSCANDTFDFLSKITLAGSPSD